MTLEQLRIFVAVAEREHVTRAAEILNLTQSAVSGAIAALETRHGVHLFDRIGRRIVLNEIGREFLDEARGVLARAAAAEVALTDMAAMRRGALSIHASQTIASYWLPQRLVRFHDDHPAVELRVSVGNTAEVMRAVVEGDAEIGFVEGEGDHPALHRKTVDRDRLAVLVASGHPWANGERPSAANMQRARWVLREEGSGTRATLETALQSAGLDVGKLDIAMTLPSNEAVLAAVAEGAGATALSESVASDALENGRLHRVNFDLPARAFALIHHKERYLTKAARAFIDLAQQGSA